MLCGRNRQRGEAVARELTDAGCATRFVQADLATMEDCRKVIADADTLVGKLARAGQRRRLTDRGTILDTTPELFDRIFDVNVRAPFFLMQDALKIMLREKIAGSHRQCRLHVEPWRAALHHRLLRVEGRAGDADQERRLRR